LYSKFLSKCIHRHTKNKDTNRRHDAEGHPCPRKQKVSSRKGASVAQQLREMKLSAAAQKVEESIEETLTYMDYPTEHWNLILKHH